MWNYMLRTQTSAGREFGPYLKLFCRVPTGNLLGPSSRVQQIHLGLAEKYSTEQIIAGLERLNEKHGRRAITKVEALQALEPEEGGQKEALGAGEEVIVSQLVSRNDWRTQEGDLQAQK